MVASNSSPQEGILRGRINQLLPDAYEQLENITLFEERMAFEIVSVIMQFCCASQHIGSITAGRRAFERLPRGWILKNLTSIIGNAVNLEDSWEYRRLLEVLSARNTELLHLYVSMGLKSSEAEIREVAEEYNAG